MDRTLVKKRFVGGATYLYHWLRNHNNLLVLFVAFLIVGGIWAFVNIAEEVTEGDTEQFDEWAVRALRMPDPDAAPGEVRPQVPIGPRWLREVGRDKNGRAHV